jgi:hypothetical protein
VFVGAAGSPYAAFRRAIEARNLARAITEARDLPQLSLADAAELVVMAADGHGPSFDRCAGRWAARYVLEESNVTLGEIQVVLAGLSGLREADRQAAVLALIAIFGEGGRISSDLSGACLHRHDETPERKQRSVGKSSPRCSLPPVRLASPERLPERLPLQTRRLVRSGRWRLSLLRNESLAPFYGVLSRTNVISGGSFTRSTVAYIFPRALRPAYAPVAAISFQVPSIIMRRGVGGGHG